ncbi:MAG: relaxase/mobilization nuclease domain-containing protein, partial [Gammaproteobacteria bacterium]|nr:relaxase/mobilization nuclease domain-containing protein [Gammaproteobacteria bacterium]
MIVKGFHTGSFGALARYITHDKDRASTAERVAWVQIDNCVTDSPGRVAAEMRALVARREALKAETGVSMAGRKLKEGDPGFHLIVSWAGDENPAQEEALAKAREAVEAMGLGRHQRLMACHTDSGNIHVHVLINRIDPETGRAHPLSLSKRKLQKWALDYERAQGKIRCKLREENAKKLERGEKPRYDDPVIRGAWE